MNFQWTLFGFLATISISFLPLSEGVNRRCWTCSSRGDYGDCKDPFGATPNNLDGYPGLTLPPCSTGWCGKIVESDNEELIVSTRRICLPRPPEDNVERCAETQYDKRTVYMCFCMGDLCNGASLSSPTFALMCIVTVLSAYWNLR